MQLDGISVLLGIIIVFLFMAIFNLLRTMNSPFISRFEPLVKVKMRDFEHLPGSHCIPFRYNQHDFELLEIKFPPRPGFNRVYNNYLFLRVKTKGDFSLRFRDAQGQTHVEYVLDQLYNDLAAAHSFGELANADLHVFYKDFYLMTDNPLKAHKFLKNNDVRLVLFDFRTQISFHGFLIPLVIQPGFITLDYSLTAFYLNELVNDPRNIKKHVEALDRLADELEKINVSG